MILWLCLEDLSLYKPYLPSRTNLHFCPPLSSHPTVFRTKTPTHIQIKYEINTPT